MIEGYYIVDAHCHPVADEVGGCLVNAYGTPGNEKGFFAEMRAGGIDFCCGSILRTTSGPDSPDGIVKCNAAALRLERTYPDYYQAGICIQSQSVKESVAEIEKYHKLGVTWLGEIVPRRHGYTAYSSPEMLEILAAARDLGMTVSIHPSNNEDISRLMENLPDLNVVAAHPGQRADVLERAEMMRRYPRLHWDLSGTGLFRWGMLKYLVDRCGAEKLLFGTDFPICSIAMQIYGVLAEHISDEAKTVIFSGNFARLCGREKPFSFQA
ncbi:MAG: amidohydrolase [Lentisphaeria bacterium]|nr:amidohydrolase [Lentisphaeria bacterium]